MIKPQALTAIPLCQPHQELWNSTKHGAQTEQLYLANRSQHNKKVAYAFEVTTELNCPLLPTFEL